MRFVLLIVLITIFARPVNGQALADINIYLKNTKIPKTAKQLYAGKMTPTDNDATFALIDSISTKNNATRPFYLLLASQMIDGAADSYKDRLYLACDRLFEKNPDALIGFLYGKSPLVKKFYIIDWSIAIVRGMELGNNSNAAQYFNMVEPAILEKCRKENQDSMKIFMSKVIMNMN